MFNRFVDMIRPRASSNRPLQPVAEIGGTDLRDLMLGAQVRAQVMAALPGGAYQIAIGSRTFNVRLPVNAEAGDILSLTVVARGPWPEFALAPQEPPTAEVTTLSNTGRFITELLSAGEKLPLMGSTESSTPLLPGRPENPIAIATSMRRALMESGIFYESHQAQWIAGERSINELLQEPQARLTPVNPAALGDDDVDGTTNTSLLAVHPEALPIVKQQLEALETRHLAWHGLIWPQQELQWEISEHLPRAARMPAARSWKTRLRLVLPHLGEVSATLAFDAQGIDIVLATHNALSADRLTMESPKLRQALQAAGLRPATLNVGLVEAGHG